MVRKGVLLCAGILVLGLAGVAGAQRTAAQVTPTTLDPSLNEDQAIDALAAETILDCTVCDEDSDAGAACCCECPIHTIANGEISGFGLNNPHFRGLRAVIQDPQAWAAFWQRHTAHLQPAPTPPPVDFQHFSVIVAILGVQSTGGGPGIHIVRAGRCEHSTRIHVAVQEQPGPLDVITNPFHIVKVPRICLAPPGSVLFLSHTPAQVPGLVVGRVIGAPEPGTAPSPIAGALVRLIKPADPPIVVTATETNEMGIYRFPDVPPGPYRVAAGAPGYQPLRKPVRVIAGEPAVVNFLLLPVDDSIDAAD